MQMFNISPEDLERLRAALYSDRIAFVSYLAQGHLNAAATLLADIDSGRYGLSLEGPEEKVVLEFLRGRSSIERQAFCAEEAKYLSSS
jgi:hypothetical protein